MLNLRIKPKFQIYIIFSLLLVSCVIGIGILPATSDDNAKKEIEQAATEDLEVNKLKVKDICLNGDCKASWPKLKCAEYDNRPSGESGDNFCSSMEKACFAVFIGSGASYFSECSTPPASPHKTRCCWIE